MRNPNFNDELREALDRCQIVAIDDKVEAINAATSVLTDIANTLVKIAQEMALIREAIR